MNGRLGVIDRGRVAIEATPEELQAEVSEDVVVLNGGEVQALREEVEVAVGITGVVDGDELHLRTGSGHELIPRLVESLPEGRLLSVSLRRPTLADAFLVVTGHSLGHDLEPESAALSPDEYRKSSDSSSAYGSASS